MGIERSKLMRPATKRLMAARGMLLAIQMLVSGVAALVVRARARRQHSRVI